MLDKKIFETLKCSMSEEDKKSFFKKSDIAPAQELYLKLLNEQRSKKISSK